MEITVNKDCEKDLQKLKKVISHPDNQYLHLRNITKYINLFFKKWSTVISTSQENQIISLQNELVKRLT